MSQYGFERDYVRFVRGIRAPISIILFYSFYACPGRLETTRNWHSSSVNKMAVHDGGEACGVVVEGEGMRG